MKIDDSTIIRWKLSDKWIDKFIQDFEADFRTRLMPTHKVRDEHMKDISKRLRYKLEHLNEDR